MRRVRSKYADIRRCTLVFLQMPDYIFDERILAYAHKR